MWPKLRKQIAVEREQLNRLLQEYHPLLERCAVAAPDNIELSALATCSADADSAFSTDEQRFEHVLLLVQCRMIGVGNALQRETMGYETGHVHAATRDQI